MMVGILNSFAALARATTLFFSVWRSIDCTPNAICGWWSMKMSCEFCGVRTSSFGLAIGNLLRLVATTRAAAALECASKVLLNISPQWGTQLWCFGGGTSAQSGQPMSLPARHQIELTSGCFKKLGQAVRQILSGRPVGDEEAGPVT